MKPAEKPSARTKRPYRAPELKVHGDFRKLTAAKGGTSSDGPGKPRSKASGANA